MTSEAAQQTGVSPATAALSARQAELIKEAQAQISEDGLRRRITEMAAIASPTGEERALAEYLVAAMADAGLASTYQPIDSKQGNALGRLHGTSTVGGADLLLYAPIDTHILGDEVEDCPWIGPSVRPDMRPQPFDEGGFVVGLCAENPKGYAACILTAAEAIKHAGVDLLGDLMIGFGAGGMPTNKRPVPGADRYNAGQGNGCSFMLEQGFRPDFAIIAKPGWAVAWEEVGLAWFRITVRGNLNYTGQRHRLPNRNPIVGMTKVIEGLESWFPEYTVANTSGLVAPQGSIGAIEGGWPHKPAFVPAACNLYVDLRLSPRTEPSAARRQLLTALERIESQNPGLEVDCEMILAVPGGSTPADNWIVQSSTRAWEAVEGAPHVPRTGTSGATDANILRGRGIPTARIGMPPPKQKPPYDNTFSMGVVEVAGMYALTKLLVHVAIDTCTRDRATLGL